MKQIQGWSPTRLWGRLFRRPGVPFTRARLALGIRGEDLACEELLRNGYRILARRARCRLGEIDIVARDGEVLAFVEVKTRRGQRHGCPEEAVTLRKQRKLIRLARAYVRRKHLPSGPMRFDVVGVELLPDRSPRITLLRGTFIERTS